MEIQTIWEERPMVVSGTGNDRITMDLGPAITSFDNFTRSSYSASGQQNRGLIGRMNNVRVYTGSSGSKAEGTGEEPVLLAYNGPGAAFGPLESGQVQGKNGLWLNGFGQWGRQKGDPGFLGYDYNLYGFTLGLDHLFGDRWVAGVAVGKSVTDVTLDQGQGDGSVQNIFGSIYASYFTKEIYLDAVFSYARGKFNNQRKVVFGSVERDAVSDHHGDTFSGVVGGGYYFRSGIWALGPYAQIQYINLDEAAFQETGAESLNLQVDSRRTQSLVSELGIRLAASYRFGSGTLIPEVNAGWNYDFDIDDRAVHASLQGAPETGFSIRSQDVDRNGLIAGAGVRFIHESGFIVALRYGGDFRGSYQAHSLLGEIRLVF